MEQEAVANSLRRELKAAFEDRDEMIRRGRENEEFRIKAEGQLLKLGGLTEQVSTLQTSLEDSTSLITRLRAEAQASERNHAMRTAMLATCEAQVAHLQKVSVSPPFDAVMTWRGDASLLCIVRRRRRKRRRMPPPHKPSSLFRRP
jgi:hypothetical protein